MFTSRAGPFSLAVTAGAVTACGTILAASLEPATPVSTANPSSPVISITSAPTARLFSGDYGTGDFSQWLYVQNRNFNGTASDYAPSYPATIVSDPVKGNVARFEVHEGDGAIGENGNVVNRSEVEAPHATSGGIEGQTRWYQFSVRFDPAFPLNEPDSGWAVTNGWHASTPIGSGPIEFAVDPVEGSWRLDIERQSRPAVYLGSTLTLWKVPLGTDWHDVKMQIHWSPSDADGWIRLWHNGVPQTLANGSDTYFVRTMVPGTSGVYYKEGYYRKAMKEPGVVYHTGFRSADDESALLP